MQGLLLGNLPSPRSTEINSWTIPLTVAAGTTRIVNFYGEFRALARSIAFVNRDAANTCLVILNNDRINTFTIAPNSTFNFNDQWCEQVEIVAGAAGAVNLFLEVVPAKELGFSEI